MNRIEEAAYFILATGWGRVVLFVALATTAYILGHQALGVYYEERTTAVMNLNNMGTGRQVLRNVLAQTQTKQWSKTQKVLSQTSTKNSKVNTDGRPNQGAQNNCTDSE